MLLHQILYWGAIACATFFGIIVTLLVSLIGVILIVMFNPVTWFFLIIGGIVYFVWKHNQKKNGCDRQ